LFDEDKDRKALLYNQMARDLYNFGIDCPGLLQWSSGVALLGRLPLEAYGMMIKGSLSDFYGISETVAKTIPLTMCSLAVALSFTMVVWNIGAEGQFVLGLWPVRPWSGTWISIIP